LEKHLKTGYTVIKQEKTGKTGKTGKIRKNREEK
jgi:hypothetical protein